MPGRSDYVAPWHGEGAELPENPLVTPWLERQLALSQDARPDVYGRDPEYVPQNETGDPPELTLPTAPMMGAAEIAYLRELTEWADAASDVDDGAYDHGMILEHVVGELRALLEPWK